MIGNRKTHVLNNSIPYTHHPPPNTFFMAFKIYTKTGDKGVTGLIGGSKVLKSHVRIESYGTIDELNSYIGLCADLLHYSESKTTLKEIQDRLFTIGAELAVDPEKNSQTKIPDLHDADISLLETEIDRMTAALPEMKFFILPGGHATVSHIHIARCVCRRAERICVGMQAEGIAIEAIIIRYLNRLSDYLFTLARFTGMQLGAAEIPWKPRV